MYYHLLSLLITLLSLLITYHTTRRVRFPHVQFLRYPIALGFVLTRCSTHCKFMDEFTAIPKYSINSQNVPQVLQQMHHQYNYEEKCSMIPFPSTNSCAMNPAAANMARRPFCNSFVCKILNSSSSAGLRLSGSNPISPGM